MEMAKMMQTVKYESIGLHSEGKYPPICHANRFSGYYDLLQITTGILLVPNECHQLILQNNLCPYSGDWHDPLYPDRRQY